MDTKPQDTDEPLPSYMLDDDTFDELEAVLTSDDVPADCMNVEMLDGYLAALLAAPERFDAAIWLPGVWSADPDSASFSSRNKMQRAIELVLRYYNELAATIGAQGDWEPFCYADLNDDSELRVGDEWVAGFAQGLDLWPLDWMETFPKTDTDEIRRYLDDLLTPWESEHKDTADNATRLEWLAAARNSVISLCEHWHKLGLARPQALQIDSAAKAASATGRNVPCSCGSGEKYKKCCGNS